MESGIKKVFGIFINEDPNIFAFIYASLVTALIHYCEREPEKESIIILQVDTYVKRLINRYKNTEKNHAE